MSNIVPIGKRGLNNSGLLQNPEIPKRKRSMRSIAGKKMKSESEARHTSKSAIAGSRRNMQIPRHLQSREIRRLLNCWQSMTAGKRTGRSVSVSRERQSAELRKRHVKI